MSLPFTPSLLKFLNLPSPPPQEPMKLPTPEGFPEWYSNDPNKIWKSGSWEDYTNAADQLDVVKSDDGFYSLQKRENSASTPKSDDGFYSLQKRENSASTPCTEDLVSSEFRLYKDCYREEFIFPYSKITMTDQQNFHLLLDQAEKDLQLFEDYFTPDGKHAILQHDTTVENVIGRLPSEYINITQYPMFPRLLKRLISMAKLQHRQELFRDYTLFLPKCECIKSGTSPKECLEMLKDDPNFVDSKFVDLDSYDLLRGMQLYVNYREAGEDMTQYNHLIEQDYQQEQDVMWKARSRLPGELMTPIRFLAFLKRCKGYQVQHPVKEIMKFRAYFGKFFKGVPPPQSPPPQSPEPSHVGSSPYLERPMKRVRHC